MIGWGMYIICNLCLAAIQTPSIGTLAFFIFMMTMGFVQVIKYRLIEIDFRTIIIKRLIKIDFGGGIYFFFVMFNY